MGKIKSAIVTTIVALATLVLFFFGVVSCALPDGVHRYNSMLSAIHLGSDLSGDAYATLLPEGVITADEYDFTVSDTENEEQAAEYKDTYVASASGAYYVDKDVLAAYSDNQTEAFSLLAKDVKSDAEIISARFAGRRLSSYSVSVADGCAVRVAVATNFTYAAYSGNDSNSLSEDLTYASSAISYLTLGGGLTLRNTVIGRADLVTSSASSSGATVTYNLLSARTDVSDLFKGASYYGIGGTYAVRVDLTEEGKEEISSVSSDVAASDDTNILFYVGDVNVISLTCEAQITESTFYIQVNDEETARNYAAILNSVATGNPLSMEYTYDEVIYDTAATGTNSAMFFAIGALVVLVAAMVYSIARYKKLGLTFALMLLLFASAMVAIVYLVGLTLTTAGVFVGVLCLALFAISNFWAFENIRRETKEGRTVQASVKLGYKKSIAGVLDLHIVLVVISVIVALVCATEAAACGLILMIGTLASYVLHWFTRFMWYVTMSPARDKYKFCGFKREVLDDDE